MTPKRRNYNGADKLPGELHQYSQRGASGHSRAGWERTHPHETMMGQEAGLKYDISHRIHPSSSQMLAGLLLHIQT